MPKTTPQRLRKRYLVDNYAIQIVLVTRFVKNELGNLVNSDLRNKLAQRGERLNPFRWSFPQ